MDKNKVKEILESMDVKNKSTLQEYINKLSNVTDEFVQNILKENNIQTEEDLRNYVKRNIDVESKFIELNGLVSYGRSRDTIHIHVVPKDAKFLLNRNGLNIAEYELIDALEKLQEIIKIDEELKDVKQIYAVSGLIKKPISTIFEKLDFDVKTMKIKEAKEDQELSHFYDRFQDKKDLGRAKLSKEKLLSEEWNKLKDDRKKELCSILKIEEVNELARNNVIEDVEKVLIEEMQNKKEKVI